LVDGLSRIGLTSVEVGLRGLPTLVACSKQFFRNNPK
jgi:hypothetical protein